MTSIVRVALAFVLLAIATATANAQTTMRVRGTITAFDANVLSVKTRDGKDVQLKLTDNAAVAAAKAMTLEELKPGDYVGTTSRMRADGVPAAVEVHTLAPTTAPGHIPWDLEPGSMMTNGNVASIVRAAGGQELVLDYKGGTQKIAVPPGTPIVTNTPADRSYLKPGEYIFAVAQVAADGAMTVSRVTVSKDGVRPPQ